jgi:electron transfer flavoprotein beta subunit
MRRDVPLVLNPLDKNAMEAALQLKAQLGAHVTVLSMGPPPAAKIVKECLALGADRGILLCDQALAGADAYATAYTLARAIEKIGLCDVIFCGRASSDGGTEWVGPKIAAFLDLPVVTMVKEIVECGGVREPTRLSVRLRARLRDRLSAIEATHAEGSSQAHPDEEWWKVKASLENGYRLVRVRLPAVLTVTRDLNTPRILSFSGIIKSRRKEIIQWGLDELGVSEEHVGLKGSPTIVSDMRTMESKREVEMIGGTRKEMAERLVQKLADAGLI